MYRYTYTCMIIMLKIVEYNISIYKSMRTYVYVANKGISEINIEVV
jgi:hypothetical protein